MSTSVEEVRRAAFEAWAVTRRHPTNGLPFFVMKNESGKYLDGTTEYAWEGFNAALDSIFIELPRASDYTGCNLAIEDCRAAIEQAGLGLKVKP
jgi:hypothetical protein